MRGRRGFWRRLLRRLVLAAGALVLLSVLMVASLRFINPVTSGFMLQARIQSWFDDRPGTLTIRRQWRDFDRISPELALAVVASEDQRFTTHHGFDFREIQNALREAEAGGRMRGASTITQQVAKNLFLWNGRSWLRKGLEAWFTVLVELFWPKQRILEVYLNIAEFGPGIYGAEAAAQAFFRKPAGRLTRSEAARLAAVLPNPKRLSAGNPGPYVQRRAAWIQRQMRQLGGQAHLRQLD